MTGATVSAPEPGLVDSLMVLAFFPRTFDPTTSSIDQILGPGRLTLVRSQELRREVARWRATLQDFTEDEDWAFDMVMGNLLPLVYPRLPMYAKGVRRRSPRVAPQAVARRSIVSIEGRTRPFSSREIADWVVPTRWAKSA